MLVFRMEILKIKGDKKPADRCDPNTLTGCNDKQKAYIEKQSKLQSADKQKELKRLQGLEGGQMKPDNRNWLLSRIRLLTKMVKRMRSSE